MRSRYYAINIDIPSNIPFEEHVVKAKLGDTDQSLPLCPLALKMEDVAHGWRLGRSLHIKDPLRSSLSGILLLVANELGGEIIIHCICALNINFLRVYLDKLILFHWTLKPKMRLFNRLTHLFSVYLWPYLCDGTLFCLYQHSTCALTHKQC